VGKKKKVSKKKKRTSRIQLKQHKKISHLWGKKEDHRSRLELHKKEKLKASHPQK